MPQMSPMIWVVFPLIMISLVVASLVILDEEYNVVSVDWWDSESNIKMVKW